MPPPEAQPAPVQVFVGLGANLGDPAMALQDAVQALAMLPDTQLVQCSSFYCSAALGAAGPDYLNAVVELATALDAFALLAHLQGIEAAAGRTRPYPNAPRTLDLDLLLYGDLRIDSPSLTVPHPRMGERAFVLQPLAEIAPQRVSADALKAVADQTIECRDRRRA